MPRRRRDVLAVAAVTLLIVSALVGFRVCSTEVELDLHVSQVTFVLPAANAISDPLEVTSLGASNLAAVELPRSRLREGIRLDGPTILLSVADTGGRRGSINLEALTPAANAKISLRKSRLPRAYELFVNNSSDSSNDMITASVYGPVQIVVGQRRETVEFPVPRQVALLPGHGPVKLDVTTADTAPLVLSYQLPVRQLQLSRIDEFTHFNKPLERSISTIVSGTVSLESIDGEPRTLRSGEGLQFEASEGDIRALELGDDIRLQFVGRVRGMTTGTGSVRRSLMPTWFDWLSARHRVPLLWGAGAYLFGVFTAVLRWWKNP